MGRAVFGVFLGIAIVALAIFVVKRWAPSPGDDIEWVHGESSIIVQMKTGSVAGPDPVLDEVKSKLAVPELTVYGDGTLVEKDVTGSRGYSLHRKVLPDTEVRALLRFLKDKGFFDMSYQQAGGPPPETKSRVTHFYAALKETQNATSATFPLIAIDSPLEVQPANYRKLDQIRGRLYQEFGGSDVSPYEPDAVVLVVKATDAIPVDAGQREWPISAISLAQIAPADGSVGEQRFEGEIAKTIIANGLPTDGGYFSQNGHLFAAGYRPVLPHEDNFPEFEPDNG